MTKARSNYKMMIYWEEQFTEEMACLFHTRYMWVCECVCVCGTHKKGQVSLIHFTSQRWGAIRHRSWFTACELQWVIKYVYYPPTCKPQHPTPPTVPRQNTSYAHKCWHILKDTWLNSYISKCKFKYKCPKFEFYNFIGP